MQNEEQWFKDLKYLLNNNPNHLLEVLEETLDNAQDYLDNPSKTNLDRVKLGIRLYKKLISEINIESIKININE